VLLKKQGGIPLGRSRRDCEDNIKVGLKGVQWDVVDQIHLDEYRDNWQTFINTGLNVLTPVKPRHFFTSCEPLSFSEITVLYGVWFSSLPLFDYSNFRTLVVNVHHLLHMSKL
jgi:hypothetical protein